MDNRKNKTGEFIPLSASKGAERHEHGFLTGRQTRAPDSREKSFLEK